ncbi:MAG: hypothetical protein U1F30_07925 [Steroidobacteraceae bacterium]
MLRLAAELRAAGRGCAALAQRLNDPDWLLALLEGHRRPAAAGAFAAALQAWAARAVATGTPPAEAAR